MKKLVSEEVHEMFVELVVSYAIKNGMTIGNIVDSLEDVVQLYLDNAQLNMECVVNEVDHQESVFFDLSRDEIIQELSSRKSITHLKINEGNGATIQHIGGQLSIDEPCHIFVIKEN